MDNKAPISQDMEYPDISEAVRRYSAERMYDLVQKLEPHISNLYEGGPDGLAFMEPLRITVHTQIAKLYLSAVKELGALYRVNHAPVEPADEEPMIPAAQVPLMIERAVENAVETAVREAVAQVRQEKEERARVDAARAREALTSALVRIKSRSA